MVHEDVTAYVELVRTLRSLEHEGLEPAAVSALREAADARLFGDADAPRQSRAADAVLARLDGEHRLDGQQLGAIWSDLHAIGPVAP